MKNNLKSNNTAMRVLEIIKILIKQDASADILLHGIEEKENINNVYTKETLIKYFNTLKLVGLEVKRDKQLYSLNNVLTETKIEYEDLKLLYLLHNTVVNMHNNKLKENYQRFINKFIKTFSKSNTELYKNLFENTPVEEFEDNYAKYEKLINILEKYCTDYQKIKLTYKNSFNQETETNIFEPKELIYDKSNIYLLCYKPETGYNYKILLDYIIECSQLPQKSTNFKLNSTVVFKLKDRLAKLYKLKDSERIIDFDKNTIIVSNSEEDINILLKRLLKYGENCQIINPKDVQDKIINLTNKMIENLES